MISLVFTDRFGLKIGGFDTGDVWFALFVVCLVMIVFGWVRCLVLIVLYILIFFIFDFVLFIV